ncbi:phage major capsid protein [Mycolicibacterium litorale]|uniref:phage major capsid protein n=1 Tax=Mycolicibacterium litorale TaxID=758802 RepID=UPI001626C92A|nr:phage major capsid protein [Mycolicibacterium litorale]
MAQLIEARRTAMTERIALLDRARSEDREHLNDAEQRSYDRLSGDIAALDDRIDETQAEIKRAGHGNPDVEHVRRAQRGGVTEARDWAQRAATELLRLGGESRAISSGSLDVPSLINPSITPMSRPQRLIDLLVNRLPLNDGAAFEYHRQTVRTNNAAPVADNALKPTSVMTLTPVEDRARVIAHLSEPVPNRLVMDVPGFQDWLTTDLAEGVLDALERQVINGDAIGENFDGVLHVAGTRQVAFTTDVPRTLRKALTVAQNAGENPNAIVLSPSDAEDLDLSREGAGGGWLLPNALTGTPGGNIFGGPTITRVISPSMPAGLAVLGDWSKIQLMIREQVGVQIDAGGDLFTHNQFRARAEMRCGVAHLRPSAFIVADLVA